MNTVRTTQRRRLPPAVHRIRLAQGRDDERTVRDLDDAGFPPDSAVHQRADPGELEDGVRVGDIYLLERDHRPVAYLHIDRQTPGRVYVSGLAVHPSVQGGGLGRLIIEHFLHSMRPLISTTAVITVTSPHNHPMLGLMMTHGFAARWALPDYFGPGRDRFCCQLATPSDGTAPGHPRASSPTWPNALRVPAADLPRVYELMNDQAHVVRAIVQGEVGPMFVMSRASPGEFLDCPGPRSRKCFYNIRMKRRLVSPDCESGLG